ncbi:MAG: right-handed parallel beta-helix repeat-containing protein [Caldilineaceae bacterium]
MKTKGTGYLSMTLGKVHRLVIRHAILPLLGAMILFSLGQSAIWPAVLAEEAVYYVALSGSDGNPGTVDRPFRTIQFAVNQLKPGNTLLVRAGVYQEVLHIQKSGTAELPITIAAHPGETVVIDGNYALPPVPSTGWAACNETVSPPKCFHWGSLVRIVGSFITFDGFEITRSLGRGLVVSPANGVRPTDVTIKNNSIHDNRNAGVLISETNRVIFEANDVWHSSDYATHDRSASTLNWPVAVSGRATTNTIYRRNRIFNNWTEGLDTGTDSTNVTVEDNEFFDNYALQLYINRSQQVVIQRNLVYCTNNPNFYRNGVIPPGIVLNNEITTGGTILLSHVQLLNNIVAGCDHNFGLWGGQGTEKIGASHILIANNLLLNGIANQTKAPATEFYIVTAPHSQITVKDNIILQAGQNSIVVPTSAELLFTHNWWLRQPPSNVTSATDRIGEPGLRNPYGFLTPGQVDVNSFKLSPSAPAAGAGVGPTAYVADARGPQRGSTPPDPTPQASTITIRHDAQPDSKTNFRFTGTLGAFQLDDPPKDDRDAYTNQYTVQVAPGVYTVSEEVPSGLYLTITCDPSAKATINTATNRVTINAGSGDTITCTFTNQKAATIRAQKYHDRNGNRTRQGSEPWLAKWTINLYDAQGALVGAQVTNKLGKVSFSKVRPGAYTMCEVLSSGWINTQPGALNPVYQQPCYPLTAAPGQTVQAVFGNNQTGATRALAADSHDGLLFLPVAEPETADEEGIAEEVAEEVDEWVTTPDFEQTVFLPLINR